eukprot:1041476-Rhodomonas_salina.1
MSLTTITTTKTDFQRVSLNTQSSAVIDSIPNSLFFFVNVCHHSLPLAPSPYTLHNLSVSDQWLESLAFKYAVLTSP